MVKTGWTATRDSTFSGPFPFTLRLGSMFVAGHEKLLSFWLAASPFQRQSSPNFKQSCLHYHRAFGSVRICHVFSGSFCAWRHLP
jgi:hypothetical protein